MGARKDKTGPKYLNWLQFGIIKIFIYFSPVHSLNWAAKFLLT